jgi:hypothetical protein
MIVREPSVADKTNWLGKNGFYRRQPTQPSPSKHRRKKAMAKKQGHERGVGPYAKNDVKLTRDESGLGYPKPVDISRRVDPSWKRTDGFSAKLDKGPKEDA